MRTRPQAQKLKCFYLHGNTVKYIFIPFILFYLEKLEAIIKMRTSILIYKIRLAIYFSYQN